MLCRSKPSYITEALTLLFFAALDAGDVDACERLFKQGANLYCERAGGIRAIHIAVCRGHLNLLKWLHYRGMPSRIEKAMHGGTGGAGKGVGTRKWLEVRERGGD